MSLLTCFNQSMTVVKQIDATSWPTIPAKDDEVVLNGLLWKVRRRTFAVKDGESVNIDVYLGDARSV